MGLGASHRGGGSGSAPSHRAEPSRRRRPSIRRTISSFLLCGVSPSSSRVMEDFPAEILVTSAETCEGQRLKYKRKGSALSLNDITKDSVSSGRCMTGNEIAAFQKVASNEGPRDKGKLLTESGKMISCQSMASSSGYDTASASGMVQSSPDCVSATEIADFDDMKDTSSITTRDSSHIYEDLSNSDHFPCHCSREISLDEVSSRNSIAEAVDSHSGDSSSYFPDSPIAFHIMQNDNIWGMMPSTSEFLLLEREQNRQEGSVLQVDSMGASSNILPSNSVEINGQDIRNYRRSYSFSRNSVFSLDESDYSRSPDGSRHDFSGELFRDNIGESFASLGSGTHDSNELGWNSRSEFWERLRGSLDTTDTPTNGCPRRIHASSSCICRSDLSEEEPGSRAISRIVVLAQTLFEVLDQIHQLPMSVSLPVVSHPAPESAVDSLPLKIHSKEEMLECAEDISQCHICLSAYEEGDKIRLLPCQHEYHMSCVDKWLKEIHGVCPLCRRDVCKAVTEASSPNLRTPPH